MSEDLRALERAAALDPLDREAARALDVERRRRGVAEIKRPLVVGYGGGVNSMAMLLGMRDRGIRPDLVMFADTGGEKPGTYEYLNEILPRWLERSGFPPLTIVRTVCPETGDKTLEENCLRNETLPSRAFGFSSCAHRWKIEPQEKFMNHWPPALEARARGEKPTKAIGYDYGEGHRSHRPEDERLYYYYPLRDWRWDREACEARILQDSLPLPPKSACYFCPSSKKHEIIALKREHPDLFERAVAMERRATASLKNPLRDVKGLGRHFAWAELVAADEAQQRMFPDAPVEGCLICTEGNDEP
jgi:3'-phosphoadenosine 5'-phosphosulfate sulfotransferase (PAPS reductase)/FAD synthetase